MSSIENNNKHKAQMPHLSLSHVSHAFGKLEILDDINFKLEQGQIISVVGPSGCGKTTLLRLCAGLMDVEDGVLENHFDSSAFVFQEPRLLPWQNVVDNIALGLKAKICSTSKKERSIGPQQLKQKAQDMALKFGLAEDDFSKYPAQLSGGMRQRVSFARALILEPQLLFLDEPFSALDIGLKKELQGHLLEMAERNKMSVLFITHDLMEAIFLSDHMLLLSGSPGQISHRFSFTKPRNERSDDYVFAQLSQLLQHPKIREGFELTT